MIDPERSAELVVALGAVASICGVAVDGGRVVKIDFVDKPSPEQEAVAWKIAAEFDLNAVSARESARQQILSVLSALDSGKATSEQVQKCLAHLIRRVG
jgi:predicted  nucleic acid-binding Zn ribbon protein